MNQYALAIFGMVATVIITLAYAEGLLTQFLRNFASIISCAYDVVISDIFFGWINDTSDVIEVRITKPFHAFIEKIPRIIKALFITLVGVAIFAFDHFYATKIFAEDQTKFYDFMIMGTKYWVTELAFWYGIVILSYGILYLAIIIIGAILSLIDCPIRIAIVIRK